MSSVSYYISNLLEKMTSTDKDFRFMATTDLMVELQKDVKLDEESERKVLQSLLNLLDDRNGEVQNLAVRCLAPLVNKMKEFQVETLVDTLCSNMMSDKEPLRDTSSMALKAVIVELPSSSSGVSLTTSVCKKITCQLIGAMGKHDDVSVQLEALDILSDMLGRLSSSLVIFHDSIMSSLLPQLTSPRMAVRKRCILALGHLVPCCSPALFSRLTEHLLDELSMGPPTSMTRTYIQCLVTISRQGGARVGEHIEKLVPVVIKITAEEDDDELRESCFQAFEAFLHRCPKEMAPHVAMVTELCLKFMTFDPNYNDDDDADEEEDSMDVEEGLDQESDDEYSDDEDLSWKVRRASVKCLDTLMATRPDLLFSFYTAVCPALLARFKEREESVRADILAAVVTLLRQTRAGWSHHGAACAVDNTDAGEETPLGMLKKQVPVILKAPHRQMKEKSLKSRQGFFSVLTELIYTIPGALLQYTPALIPGIVFSLTDKATSSTMRIDALSFLHVILLSHSGHVFQPHLQVLVPPVVRCVDDSFYKITSEALLVTQQLIHVMRAEGGAPSGSGFDPRPFVKEVFPGLWKRLKATDIDQEVKERAISCMAHMVCYLGDYLGAELQAVLGIFLERLKNEITRLTAVRAITLISGSHLKIDLTSIIPGVLAILSSFLRKNQRVLKLATLGCLTALLSRHTRGLTPTALHPLLEELPVLVHESDMHVSQVALELLTRVAEACPSSLASVSSSLLPGVLRLVRSPLIQEGALVAILEFLQALVLSKDSHLSYSQLVKSLTGPFHGGATPPGESPGPFHRQTFRSVARCVAALSATCPERLPDLVKGLLQEVTSISTSESARILALLCLGEVGRCGSLGGHQEVQGVILEAFSNPSEEVKTAASSALGSLAAGGLHDYLPLLLREISSQPRKQYLLLHSLKDTISASQPSSLSPHVECVWGLLSEISESVEEGTRGLVAECMGKLTSTQPALLLPRLLQQLNAGSALARTTVITAVKFTIVDHPAPIDTLLQNCIGDFLKLQDDDINVRRVALVMLNSAAHNKPSLIRGLLPTILPQLYKETQIRRDLIREVEMGPFKHTVDEGLDVRKVAFEVMYTLLDGSLDALDLLLFLEHVEDGLKDHYDIRMLTFLMLARLASLCPGAVLQRLDRLVEPLRATCTAKVKAGSVKQEFEKQEELRRSAMRTVAALLAIPEVERSLSMADFASQIRNNQDMASILQSVRGEVMDTS